MAYSTRKSLFKYKKEMAAILLCIFCRHNLCCRLWQDGRENCSSFLMSIF